jgi:hypothetical protein
VTARRWTSRTGTADDAARILDLRRACFGEVDPVRLRPDVWRWQFVDNPAGPGWIRLADDDGTIAGQYAAIPTRFRIGGVERTFAMSCDTMTHPDYQKQGIFVTLARELYDEIAARSGVTTVWGFPNAASHPGFVGKLGWFDVDELPTWVKPLRSRSVLQRYLHSGALAGALGAVADGLYRLVTPRPRAPRRCTIRPLATFDERFDALWERHRDRAPVAQVRDAAFLRWRYQAVPAFGYEPFEVLVGGRLEGFLVLRSLTLFDLPFAAVVDLFPCPIVDAEVTREVLSFAQLRAVERGAAFLTALVPPAQTRQLTRFGFLRVPGFMNLRRWILGARCTPEDERTLRPIANWSITYGDADII